MEEEKAELMGVWLLGCLAATGLASLLQRELLGQGHGWSRHITKSVSRSGVQEPKLDPGAQGSCPW